MKKCEVIIKFDWDDFDFLKSKLDLKEVKIFTNDPLILDKGRESNIDINLLSTYFGFFNSDYDQIENISIERLELLEKNLQDGTLERQSIIYGMRYTNLLNLIDLERIKKILAREEKIIFLFRGVQGYYFSILKLAESMGFENKYGVSQILKNKLVTINPNDRMSLFDKLKQTLEIKRQINRYDSYPFRLKKHFGKIRGKMGFFLINNETDFYLKPIYPILKKIRESQEEVYIFTFDDRTSEQLSEHKFHSTNLLEYVREAKVRYRFGFKEFREAISGNLNINDVFFDEEFETVKKFRNWKITKRISSWLSTKDGIRAGLKRIVNIVVFIDLGLKFSFEIITYKIKRKLFVTYAKYLANFWLFRKILLMYTKRYEDYEGYIFTDYINQIPRIEAVKILTFLEDASSFKSTDKILELYMHSFKDNYIVGRLPILLIIHYLIKKCCNELKFRSMLIGADSSPFNNVVCNVAKKYDIPTFSIPQVYIKIPKISTVIPMASKILVSGESVKNEFIKLGMNEEKIIVTGNPRYDYIGNRSSNNTTNKKLLVVAMSRWKEEDPYWMSEIIDFCNKIGLEVLIKIHPMYKFGSNKDHSKNMVKKIKEKCKGLNYLVSYETDWTKLFPKTFALVTEYSIVAVESAFNNVPVIIANINREKDSEYSKAYSDEGIALYSESINELKVNIEKMVNNEESRENMIRNIEKFNHNYNYLHDGNASQRIFDILKNQIASESHILE